jgi:ACR3 family arsenite efflux pump ArsB
MSAFQIALVVLLFVLTPFLAGALILSVLAFSDTETVLEIDDSEED